MIRQAGSSGLARRPSVFSQNTSRAGVTYNTASVQAPVGGWNARDSIAAMPPMDAVILENFFPETDGVYLRSGFENHVTGFADEVRTLMQYSAIDGSHELFAASGSAIYDATTAGTVGAGVVTGLNSVDFNYVNFTNSSAISYLCAFNDDVDNPWYYNGTNWIEITGVSTPAITGVTPADLKNPWVHKRRLWVIERNSLSAWYFPVDAVGGAAVEFPLTGLFQRGGNLRAGGTWTLDGGDGLDDYQVFISSEGEILIYQGIDPSSNFVLAGRYFIAEPIGERCLFKLAGDLLIITTSGVFPLSQAFQAGQVNPRTAITNKIDGAISRAARLYKSNFGWELNFYPERNMLILNVPINEGADQEQYVMNTITGAWGQFKGINANCWALSNEQMYFGNTNSVQIFGEAKSDNGANINGDILTAFSFFEAAGVEKHFKMIRPFFSTNGQPTVLAALNVDYETFAPSAPLAFTGTTSGLWDIGLWDQALWGGQVQILKDWETTTAVGSAAALRLLTACAGIDLSLQAIEYVYEVGQPV